MIEVDTVSNTVHDGEKEGSKSYDFVEGDGSIKGHILVEGSLPEERDEVPCHGQ